MGIHFQLEHLVQAEYGRDRTWRGQRGIEVVNASWLELMVQREDSQRISGDLQSILVLRQAVSLKQSAPLSRLGSLLMIPSLPGPMAMTNIEVWKN